MGYATLLSLDTPNAEHRLQIDRKKTSLALLASVKAACFQTIFFFA